MVPCAHFCLYIKGKRNDYTNGTAIYTHEQLILLASNKYNLLVQEGIFGAKSLEEEKIIAMQAELTALKGQFVLAPSLQRAAGDKKDGEKKDNVKKDQPKGKKKNKKNTENKKKQKKMEKWQCVPSKDGESHEKKHDNRTYYWCFQHMVWGNHSAKDAWAKTARRSRTRDATHMQLWLPLPLLANLSGLISLQICTAT